MKQIVFLLIVILSFISFSKVIFADSTNVKPNIKISSDKYKKAKSDMPPKEELSSSGFKANETDLIPKKLPNSIKDSTVLRKYKESYQEYYNYKIFGLKHRAKVFSWQHFSTKVIFIVVLILVLTGIVFSGIYFFKTIDNIKDGKDQPVTEFEASPKGFKISSPVIGLIILALSLAFFYLYLAYVYPIMEII